jgi:hypothetical protein
MYVRVCLTEWTYTWLSQTEVTLDCLRDGLSQQHSDYTFPSDRMSLHMTLPIWDQTGLSNRMILHMNRPNWVYTELSNTITRVLKLYNTALQSISAQDCQTKLRLYSYMSIKPKESSHDWERGHLYPLSPSAGNISVVPMSVTRWPWQ